MAKILGERRPAAVCSFLAKGGYKIDCQAYRWGLNDQCKRGETYSRTDFHLDAIFN